MQNTIAIDKGLIVVPPAAPGSGEDNRRLAASLQAELMNLGFMLDETAFAAACAGPTGWLVEYHREVIPHLRKRVGAERDYRPFYRNFPAQVMETSEAELFFNAVLHYWSGGAWEPPQVLRDRGFAFENVSFKPVRAATLAEFHGLFTRLAAAPQALTPRDREIVEWFADHRRGSITLPDNIPFKETLCVLAAKGLDVPVKTPTDVLRIAVHLSGGDVSLPGVPKATVKEDELKFPASWLDHFRAHRQHYLDTWRKARLAAREKFKFRKLSRPQRRHLLGLLEKTGCDVTEMQRHLGRWLRLGERLHPGEHAAAFPRAAEAFRVLRNQRKGHKVRTFAARVNLAFREDWRKGVDLLTTRPGEFARRLDWMLRRFDRGPVLDALGRVAPLVSAKVLFELYNHFAARIRADAPRTVMLKGGAKMKTLPPLPPMDADLVQQVGNVILRVMRRRIAALPPLGRVWVDARLKEVPVPFAMRSVNTAVRTYVRGTRVPFRADAKVVRPFIHWYDEKGTEDLDLSVGLYDDKLKLVTHVSFTNLKDSPLNCCHSGDVRHRIGPSAEYVDLDVQRCLAGGLRYGVVQVYNYNGRPMHTVKDCVFGLMEREHPRANEVFVPKTVSNCMGLANEGTCVVVCVIDLRDRQYVWADVESRQGLPTLETGAGQTGQVLRALLSGTRMSVYDLLAMHASERGMPAPDPSSADLALRWEDLVSDYAKVLSYMAF